MIRNLLLCAALTFAAATVSAETMTLSYSNGEFAGDTPTGPGFGDNDWIEVAIYIPASTVRTLAGSKITEITGYLPSIADISTVRAWVRTDLEGEDLAGYTLVPNQLNNIKRGANKLKFKTPWQIPEGFDSGIYLGFGHKIDSGNARGLSVVRSGIPGAFFLHRGDGKWYDFSDRGTACLEATVEGDNLPAHNLRLSKTSASDYYVMDKGNYSMDLTIHNFGTETITGFDIVAASAETGEVRIPVNTEVKPGKMAVVTRTFELPFESKGKKEIALSIDNLKEGTDADTDDNSLTASLTALPTSYPRHILSEEFTTEWCGSCPPVVKMMHELLARPENADVIQVCHHAGYKTDFLTEPWHTTYTELYGGGTFAPGLCADRSKVDANTVVFFPETEEMVTELWAKRMAEPAFVSVNVSAEYGDAEETRLTVTVTGEKCLDTMPGIPVVNVMLTESDIPQQSQASAYQGFVHDYVSRAVSAENHWGDALTFDGDSFSYTCAFDLKPEWKKENMQIVALMGDSQRWDKREIYNAGRLLFSEIGANSVDRAASNPERISVEYFDLSGRRLSAPAEGVGVVRTTYSDGSVKSIKQISK